MGRHARAVADDRVRYARPVAVTAVWLVGLAAGFFALIGAAAKYTTCGATSTGLACRGSGTALGVLLVVAVIATVTTVTVVTHGQRPGRVAGVSAAGLCVLGVLLLLARALVGTA